MKTAVEKVLILKLVQVNKGAHESTMYKDVTESFDGRKYNNPEVEGRFLEVEVMRNFLVSKKEEFVIEELDPVEAQPA